MSTLQHGLPIKRPDRAAGRIQPPAAAWVVRAEHARQQSIFSGRLMLLGLLGALGALLTAHLALALAGGSISLPYLFLLALVAMTGGEGIGWLTGKLWSVSPQDVRSDLRKKRQMNFVLGCSALWGALMVHPSILIYFLGAAIF